MKMWLVVVVLLVAGLVGPARATSIYEFFVGAEKQDTDLQIAFVTEAYRSVRAREGGRAGCITANFVKSGPAFLPAYEDFKTELYSANQPEDSIEGSIVEAISDTCGPSRLAETPAITSADPFVHHFAAFQADYQKQPNMIWAELLAVYTQAKRARADGNDAYAQCIGEKFGITDNKLSIAGSNLLAALKESQSTDGERIGVEGLILGAIIYYCGEEPAKAPPAASPDPESAPAPATSEIDRQNAKAYTDFRAGLDATGRVLDEMAAEQQQKLHESLNQMAEMKKHAFRLPDGRRVYGSETTGKWVFDDLSPVPADLAGKAIPPPEDGWPSLDMRIPPTLDVAALQEFILHLPKAVVEARLLGLPATEPEHSQIFAERIAVLKWDSEH